LRDVEYKEVFTSPYGLTPLGFARGTDASASPRQHTFSIITSKTLTAFKFITTVYFPSTVTDMQDTDESRIKNVIRCAYEVANELGSGFLEAVYSNALVMTLIEAGFKAEQEKPLSVHFRGYVVGNYYADIVVDDSLIIEMKAVKDLTPEHSAQTIHYLKATGLKNGLLINFGTTPIQIKRLFS